MRCTFSARSSSDLSPFDLGHWSGGVGENGLVGSGSFLEPGEGGGVVVGVMGAVEVVAPGCLGGCGVPLPLLSRRRAPCLPGLEAGLLGKSAHSFSSTLNSPPAPSSLPVSYIVGPLPYDRFHRRRYETVQARGE